MINSTVTHKPLQLSQEVLSTVVQQHERLDGSGYPIGLSGEDIHPFARISLLVDSFDALTSSRPYSPSRSAYKALTVLRNEGAGKLDFSLFRGLVNLLGNPAMVDQSRSA